LRTTSQNCGGAGRCPKASAAGSRRAVRADSGSADVRPHACRYVRGEARAPGRGRASGSVPPGRPPPRRSGSRTVRACVRARVCARKQGGHTPGHGRDGPAPRTVAGSIPAAGTFARRPGPALLLASGWPGPAWLGEGRVRMRDYRGRGRGRGPAVPLPAVSQCCAAPRCGRRGAPGSPRTTAASACT
jgi:hypothetical protein